jgi:hypothetical protein
MKAYWKNIKNKKSFVAIIAIILFILVSIGKFKPWQNAEKDGALINWDVTSYYAYLPATFIENDLSLQFIDQDSTFYWDNHRYWPETSPNGGKVIKTTMGLSFLYAPFFAIGHQYAKSQNDDSRGFSSTYEFFLVLSSICFMLLGIISLRLFLLHFYNDLTVTITLILVYIGTNLYYYLTIEPLISHSYNFTLASIFLLLTVKWHKHPSWKLSFFIGLIAGLIVLIRPVNIFIILFFLLYKVFDKDGFKIKLTLFKKEYRKLIVISIVSFLILVPQLIYWKSITDSWIFNSYVGEQFYFNNPHILDGLFSYRKGWLLYTPIMFFALIGIFFSKNFKYVILVIITPIIVILFSWWNWWYGGSFGCRPIIDFYPILAIGLAAFIHTILQVKRPFQIMTGVLFALLITFNLFQTLQRKSDAIHWESMTKEAYWHNFLSRYPLEGYHEKLQTPNIEKALKGEDEY